MTIYSAVLFVHVVSALGIFAALSFEAATLRRLRGSTGSREARVWLGYSPDLPAWGLAAFVFMLFSGIYLATEMSGWMLAWVQVAMGTLILLAPLGGVSARKMRAIRLACAAEDAEDASLPTIVRDPFLKLSINLRIALVLGVVLLMTSKPDLLESLGAIVGFTVLGLVSTAVFWRGNAVSPIRRAESRQ
jgi:hypothetical protein